MSDCSPCAAAALALQSNASHTNPIPDFSDTPPLGVGGLGQGGGNIHQLLANAYNIKKYKFNAYEFNIKQGEELQHKGSGNIIAIIATNNAGDTITYNTQPKNPVNFKIQAGNHHILKSPTKNLPLIKYSVSSPPIRNKVASFVVIEIHKL